MSDIQVIIERLNRPVEVISTFGKLLPDEQFAVYVALFKMFSLDDQIELLEELEGMLPEVIESDDEDEEEDGFSPD